MADDDYDFTLVVDDTLPSISETLENGDGTPPDLSQPGTIINLVIRDSNHARAEFGGQASFIGSGPDDPEVQYDWQDSDSTTDGVYNFRWRVTFPNGKTKTYPNGKIPRRLLISNVV